MAERQFGPYRLVRQIAVGGMAEIHLAKTKGIAGFEKYVALKMIHPNFAEDEQFIQMLVDEAKIAVQLNHGNIAQTFDLGRVGDTYYITMEYVDGADLYKILRRGSEIEIDMPLDVCAFIGKEIASALDHAHRKRDHTGKSLGIVHRDVSPQNVLISYAGEVKLVDFGIAKATMKARQTAVGVIKGKYYYMSPEQAWGDPIDYRSDIFSAGIVLYEMMTGQMLYLEEDLHRLLDMARKADIAPPSTLRKGVPPQLERIVMHALAKVPGERYQSASDFASDLERFLHAYSPVFTATKLSNLIKQIVGDPQALPTNDDYDVEVRSGPVSTHTLKDDDLIHDKEELRDENSVIFRVAELKPPPQQAKTPANPAGRVTRQAEIKDLRQPPAPPNRVPSNIPKVAKAPTPPAGAPRTPTPVSGSPKPQPRPASKPRGFDEATRDLDPVIRDFQTHDGEETHPGAGDHDADDLENIGERTMISAPPGASGYMMDVAGEDGVDATAITAAPMAPRHEEDDTGEDTTGRRQPEPDDDDDEAPTLGRADPVHRRSDEDGPTQQRDPKARVSSKRGPAPPALAAKIHAPAVSELRKPRASRRTPAEGVERPQPNVLQQIVGSQASEPMPAPPKRQEGSSAGTLPQTPRSMSQAPPLASQQPSFASSQPTLMEMNPPSQPPQQGSFNTQPQPPGYNGQPYGTDASGMPLGVSTPPPGQAMQLVPGVPPHLQPYAQNYPQQPYPGYPPQYQQPYPGAGPQQSGVTPGALYQFNPSGQPPVQMSLTGQLRLFEADELPDKYKVATGAKWLKLVIAGVIAISVAAIGTYIVMKTLREAPNEQPGSIHIESQPTGATVYYDGAKLDKPTPVTIDNVPLDSSHEVRLELPGHVPAKESVRMTKRGGEVPVMVFMKQITGKIRVVTTPDNAEIRINGEVRGRAPTTLNDIDIRSAKTIELRLKDYDPYIQPLEFPANGEINLDIKLNKLR